MMMFENIVISFLNGIGIAIIVLSFARYITTRNEAEGFILLSIGFGLSGFSYIARYIIMDDVSIMFLFAGKISIFFAVFMGLVGAYELGTGKPRTFLLANQKIHIIGSVVQKLYNWKDHYCFKAVTDVNNLSEIPIIYVIPEKEFLDPEKKLPKCPSEDSTFETDKKGKIKIDTIK